ncbi:MAG: type I methionyl aminopeptidase [Thermoanaerobaculia bacterium]
MVYRTPGELELLDEANRIVHRVLDGLAERVRPGVSTRELDSWAESEIRRAGAVPAFLHYRGYPATLCTSVDDVIVHGIPESEPLREGSIVGIDCGVLYQGFYGDAARTYAVGKVGAEARRLMTVTEAALWRAVEQVRPGGRLSDIGHAVQSYVEREGFSVVREFVGHGVGTSLHEDPQVPNYGEPGRGPRLKPGLVLAIEPMVNAGGAGVAMDPDGWTARTADGSLSAHFEFSVAVTGQGHWILGRSEAESAPLRVAEAN